MLSDRYENQLTTSSEAARDAYITGCDLLFALWPGASEEFARAAVHDPTFALSYLGTAQASTVHGNMPAANAALAEAQKLRSAVSERERSQIDFFSLFLSGQSRSALAFARSHLAEWPRDAVVMNYYGPILGLINASGHEGSKVEQAQVMDAFAPHYGDDWWFQAHRAMALCEVGRWSEARPLIEESLAANRNNAWAAHSRAHIAYEEGESDGARTFMAEWLSDYPRDGILYGHLSWHSAIAELAAGDDARAWSLFEASVDPETSKGNPRLRVVDVVQFLWRWELAGNPYDAERWQRISKFVHTMLPKATTPFGDLHVALADAAAGETATLTTRLTEMQTLAKEGNFPPGDVLFTVVKALQDYASGDYGRAVDRLSNLVGKGEQLGGGSRAQHDLVEFTAIRACVESGRLDELRHLLSIRRPGPAQPPVAGVH
jgi:hypothetical protein